VHDKQGIKVNQDFLDKNAGKGYRSNVSTIASKESRSCNDNFSSGNGRLR
jgi:hypothetical protein